MAPSREAVEASLSKAERKLEAARFLLKGGFYDDAVSRAYYSMYHAAKACLRLRDLYAKTHKGLIKRFGLDLVRTGDIERFYAKALIAAGEKREEADYGIERSIDRQEADGVVADAERFLARVRGFVDESSEPKEPAP
jgi:uncharacterized protein (UPF0332 family)